VSEIAIRAENLGKRYRVGSTAGYKTLRESLIKATTAPFRHQAPNEGAPATGKKAPYIWALKDISFGVERGHAVGVIGKNGSGKSTLLKILSRITRPTEGYAEIRGRVTSLLEVGTGFHPELTGRENINLNAAILGMKRAELKCYFDQILDFAGESIKNFIDTPVKRYSSGMYVRLAFSVAAHLDTDVLLVDEVLAVGDAEFQKKCIGKMDDIAHSGRTVLFVSHSMSAIRRLCPKAMLLDCGAIVSQGDTENVITKYMESTSGSNTVTKERVANPGESKFINWQLANSVTNEKHRCYTGEPCRFSFMLHCGTNIPQANLGFSIWAADGDLIWGMRSIDYLGGNVPLQKGDYDIVFSIPSLPVKPGNYRIRVSLYESLDECIDLWYAEPDLMVSPREETGIPTQFQGILDLPGKVSINEHK